MSSNGEAASGTTSDPLYFRQILIGRDIAQDNPIAEAMRNYVYLIGDRTTGKAVIVDPAYVPVDLVALAEHDGMEIVGAIATHFHADHIGGSISGYEVAGIEQLLSRIDVPIHIQRPELPFVTASLGVDESALKLHESGDIILVGNIALTCIHTPGHTPGSQCIYFNNTLITGDTLFLNGCGRTDLVGGDADELYESLQHRLAPIPAETGVYPGHAYAVERSASLSLLRRTNPVLFDLDKNEWKMRFTGP